MANIKIILVDTDEKYLLPLERKFIDGFEGRSDINVITEKEYLETFFRTPQKADILIINEELYDQSFERHNITNTFILTEHTMEDNSTGSLDTNQIYKYTSVKEIFNEVVNKASSKTTETLSTIEETKVIFVYSPIGGIGKTSLAAGLSAALSKNYKRVLFIGTDSLQTFGIIMNQPAVLKNGVEKLITGKHEYIYETVRSQIVTENFDILPPFPRSLSSLNIKESDYIHLLDCVKASKEYDYIIIDSSNDFSSDISNLMGYANHTIIVLGQDKNAAYKLDCLLNNIDCSDNERFIFVCNKYQQAKENILISQKYVNRCRINEYIEYVPELMDYNALSNLKSIQKLAIMFV